jgi:hypothetical protein
MNLKVNFGDFTVESYVVPSESIMLNGILAIQAVSYVGAAMVKSSLRTNQ